MEGRPALSRCHRAMPRGRHHGQPAGGVPAPCLHRGGKAALSGGRRMRRGAARRREDRERRAAALWRHHFGAAEDLAGYRGPRARHVFRRALDRRRRVGGLGRHFSRAARRRLHRGSPGRDAGFLRRRDRVVRRGSDCLVRAHPELHALGAYAAATQVWSNEVRYLGVGAMLTGGIVTLWRSARPYRQRAGRRHSRGARRTLRGCDRARGHRSLADRHRHRVGARAAGDLRAVHGADRESSRSASRWRWSSRSSDFSRPRSPDT